MTPGLRHGVPSLFERLAELQLQLLEAESTTFSIVAFAAEQ